MNIDFSCTERLPDSDQSLVDTLHAMTITSQAPSSSRPLPPRPSRHRSRVPQSRFPAGQKPSCYRRLDFSDNAINCTTNTGRVASTGRPSFFSPLPSRSRRRLRRTATISFFPPLPQAQAHSPHVVSPTTRTYTCQTCRRTFDNETNCRQHFWCNYNPK